MRAAFIPALLIPLSLVRCMQSPPQPPPGPPAYTIGDAYQSHGEWLYPRMFTNYDVTGLSEVQADDHAAFTADNEAYDAQALAAASPVLQLPAIVSVTDLVSGRSVTLRVNDRGPDNPGRVIAVTPRVAALLGFPADGVVEVEVALDVQKTAALDAALGQGPKLTAAPEAGITAQSLAPPGTTSGVGVAQDLTPQTAAAEAGDPAALSGQVTMQPPAPGPLFVQVPGFGRSRDADSILAQLYGLPARVVPVFGGDRVLYAVRLGPYTSVADADAALAQVLARGVVNPEIIVR